MFVAADIFDALHDHQLMISEWIGARELEEPGCTLIVTLVRCVRESMGNLWVFADNP